ncbi:YkgJ family cysteine cluster protein [Hyphomonas sp. UBA1923]|uniref:YkgJ family cysteine cluster protein n=1 Tax=Hyphomonas sp. UBA1923 TaxID=1946617 RepID=UPI0025BF4641|nr:YkgJ family cysteine cluster protein [Hyphomonas sp. UBA1923]|tara:strand:- start:765 stop:1538 length:774 start_codon:yes stop_codon:yes gene_type:complete
MLEALGLEIRGILTAAFERTSVAVGNGSLRDELLALQVDAQELGDRGLAAVSANGGGIACHRGCAHCCHQGVWTQPYEVLIIASDLRSIRSPEELEVLKRKILGRAKLDAGVPMDFRYWSCPLLSSGKDCIVYHNRPRACTQANSADVVPCRKAVAGARARKNSPNIPMFSYPRELVDVQRHGVNAALVEAGLFVEFVELNSALEACIDDVDEFWRRWLAGEQVFEPAPKYDAGRFAEFADSPALSQMYQEMLVELR